MARFWVPVWAVRVAHQVTAMAALEALRQQTLIKGPVVVPQNVLRAIVTQAASPSIPLGHCVSSAPQGNLPWLEPPRLAAKIAQRDTIAWREARLPHRMPALRVSLATLVQQVVCLADWVTTALNARVPRPNRARLGLLAIPLTFPPRSALPAAPQDAMATRQA